VLSIDRQSPDIAMGVNEDAAKGKEIGAGDQGLMFGYACHDTPELMPLPIQLAHEILDRLTEARQKGEVAWLRPDSKSQVTCSTRITSRLRIDTVVVSTQHAPEATHAEIRQFVIDRIVNPLLPKNNWSTARSTYHINPTGRFEVGGPHGDCGLTGRKIIVDTYGGWARHGGGPSAARTRPRSTAAPPTWPGTSPRISSPPDWPIAAKVQLAYAIGVSEPVSVLVDTEGTARSTTSGCANWCARSSIDPSGLIQLSRSSPARSIARRPRRTFRPQRSRFHLGRRPTAPASCSAAK